MSPELMKIPSMTFGESLSTSMLGFAIVFFVLIALMIMIQILRAIVQKMNASSAAPAVAAAAAPAALAPTMVPATGSLGEVKLHDVEEKTAAMIMAIVADDMKAPLNELRFHSIREKK